MHVLSWAVDKDGRTQGGFCSNISARVTYGVRTNICSLSSYIVYQSIVYDILIQKIFLNSGVFKLVM
jgi:hypothetical protein